jgi:biopolymer transport protein ExbD
MADRKIPEINAGSMADIAFLLLVFFLVTTTIQTDAGLYQMLPQWVEKSEQQEAKKKNKRNVMQVKITAGNQLIVEIGDESAQLNFEIENLREKALEFITNNGKNPAYSEKITKAAIVLQNDNGTTYDTYLRVHNELKAAHVIIQNQFSKDKFGVIYDSLTKDQQKEINELIPVFSAILSEAEATKFGKD